MHHIDKVVLFPIINYTTKDIKKDPNSFNQ